MSIREAHQMSWLRLIGIAALTASFLGEATQAQAQDHWTGVVNCVFTTNGPPGGFFFGSYSEQQVHRWEITNFMPAAMTTDEYVISWTVTGFGRQPLQDRWSYNARIAG